MSVDPAALDQPTVLDLSQQDLIALDKRGNHSTTSYRCVQERHEGALKEGLSHEQVQTSTSQAVLSRGDTTPQLAVTLYSQNRSPQVSPQSRSEVCQTSGAP